MATSRHQRVHVACCFILSFFFFTGWAADSDRPGLQLPPQMDLPTLISVIGEFTGTSVHFSPQKVSGNARLDLRNQLTADESWSVLNQVLLQHGYTTVVAGIPYIYHVVPINEAETASYVFTDPVVASAINPPPGFITLIQKLEHIGPEVAIQAVGATLGQRLQARGIGRESGQMLLAGERERVLAAIRLLGALDRPGNETGLRNYQPRYASGAKLQRALQAAWAASGKVTGKTNSLDVQLLPDGQRLLLIGTSEELPAAMSLLTDLDRAEPTITKSYRVENFRQEDVARLIEEVLGSSDDRRIKVIRDTLTGGLIITASETQHQAVQSLIRELSSAPAGSRAVVRSFIIKHRQASDLAVVLRELTKNGVVGTKSNTVSNSVEPLKTTDPVTEVSTVNAPDASSTGVSADPVDVNITVDEFSNSMIIMAPPRMLDDLAKLIDEMDRRQPQVQVEVTLVILSEGETLALGVEWAAMVKRGSTTLSVAQLLGLSKEGSGILDRTPTGTGLTSMIVNPGDYTALLQALQTVNKGRSTVTTMAVVDNNSEASINAVLQQPISNINANTNVATTTFGGTSDAGTEISVKPLINAADQVQLTFSVSQSSFVGETITTENGGVLPPPKRQDSISSVATIPDGHVIALGGLTNILDSDARTGIPFISRVPLLGSLFSNTTRTGSVSRFYLFIRADVLRHPLYEDLKYRSRAIANEAVIPADSGPKLAPIFLD